MKYLKIFIIILIIQYVIWFLVFSYIFYLNDKIEREYQVQSRIDRLKTQIIRAITPYYKNQDNWVFINWTVIFDLLFYNKNFFFIHNNIYSIYYQIFERPDYRNDYLKFRDYSYVHFRYNGYRIVLRVPNWLLNPYINTEDFYNKTRKKFQHKFFERYYIDRNKK